MPAIIAMSGMATALGTVGAMLLRAEGRRGDDDDDNDGERGACAQTRLPQEATPLDLPLVSGHKIRDVEFLV